MSNKRGLRQKISGRPYKMVIGLRTDLDMGKGKMVAQGAHAAVDVVLNSMDDSRIRKLVESWIRTGGTKIAVKIPNEQALYELSDNATACGIANYVVHDAGYTQVAPNSATAIALGPGKE